MTPLERAANAIEHEFIELADPYGSVSAYGIAHRVVRAVLTAIREPSEVMVGAAADCESSLVADVYTAMIDAALAEEGK